MSEEAQGYRIALEDVLRVHGDDDYTNEQALDQIEMIATEALRAPAPSPEQIEGQDARVRLRRWVEAAPPDTAQIMEPEGQAHLKAVLDCLDEPAEAIARALEARAEEERNGNWPRQSLSTHREREWAFREAAKIARETVPSKPEEWTDDGYFASSDAHPDPLEAGSESAREAPLNEVGAPAQPRRDELNALADDCAYGPTLEDSR